LVREMRSTGPRTVAVVNDWGDAKPVPGSRSWGAEDEGEDSGKDEQRSKKTHFVEGSKGLARSSLLKHYLKYDCG